MAQATCGKNVEGLREEQPPFHGKRTRPNEAARRRLRKLGKRRRAERNPFNEKGIEISDDGGCKLPARS